MNALWPLNPSLAVSHPFMMQFVRFFQTYYSRVHLCSFRCKISCLADEYFKVHAGNFKGGEGAGHAIRETTMELISNDVITTAKLYKFYRTGTTRRD